MKKKLALFITAAATVALAAGAGAPAAVADGVVSTGGCCLITYATATYTTATNVLTIKDNWNGDGYGVRSSYSIDGGSSGSISNVGGSNQTTTKTLTATGGPYINFNACTKNNSTGLNVQCSPNKLSVY